MYHASLLRDNNNTMSLHPYFNLLSDSRPQATYTFSMPHAETKYIPGHN